MFVESALGKACFFYPVEVAYCFVQELFFTSQPPAGRKINGVSKRMNKLKSRDCTCLQFLCQDAGKRVGQRFNSMTAMALGSMHVALGTAMVREGQGSIYVRVQG